MYGKRITLIHRVTLLFFTALVLCGIASGWITGTYIEHSMLMRSKQITVKIVSDNVRKHFVSNDFLSPMKGSDYEDFSEKIKHLSIGPNIERIKIWNKDKVVVWSESKELVGKVFSENEELDEALAGEIASEISLAKEHEPEFEHLFERLHEVYIPIIFKGQEGINTVFEIYQNLDPIFEIINKHKKIIWISTLLGFIVVYLSIFVIILGASRRIEAQTREITESEEKYRALVQSANDAIITSDHSGKIIFHNKAAAQMFGYQAGDLTDQSVTILMLERYKQKHNEGLNRFLETGEAKIIGKAVELEGLRKNGTIMPVEISLTALKKDESWIFTGIIREITDRLKALESLRESEKKFRDLFVNSRDAIAITDKAGTFIDVNQSALDLFGYTKKEIMSLNLKALYVDPSDVNRFIQEIDKKESVKDFSVKLRKKNGTVRDCLFTSTVRRSKDGSILGYQGIIRDVTEQKRNEINLKHTLQNLRKAMGATIDAMSMIVESRDPYTAGHQRRVSDLSRAIATEIGLSKDQVDGVRMAGIIHDLGKMAIPGEILTKPSLLTKKEFEIIKDHPQTGYDILKTIEFPWQVAKMVLQHHEKIDGSGYPQGLSADEILLEARILGVADVVEAMASHRPYRPALGIDIALEEISKNRGKLYDPNVVDACLKLFTEKGFKLKYP